MINQDRPHAILQLREFSINPLHLPGFDHKTPKTPVASPVAPIKHRVLAHKLVGVMLVRKNILPAAGELLQFTKNGDGLPG